MANRRAITRIPTGIRNLDAILGGGIPRGSLLILGGPPGSGKTILAQQICFHNAGPNQRVLYLNTLSESTAKAMLYMQQFDYFDASKVDVSVHFVDLGGVLRTKGLDHTSAAIMDMVKKLRPAILVFDSFKVFDDLARSKEELRRFSHELLINLIAWECTTLLLGEYELREYETNPAFSITDGLIAMSQRELSGEQQRVLQVTKLRGTQHSRDPHSFLINGSGIEVFAPGVTIRREEETGEVARAKTGVGRLDELLGDGIPRGSSILIAGVSGAGKTVLSLEFIYRGAKLHGERGIYFSYEETESRLRASARGLGWDLDEQISRGLVKLVFVPQPDILVDAHMLMMLDQTVAFGAQRVVVDSISVLLHKIKDPQVIREKVFHLASLVQNRGAVGFFVTDVAHGSSMVSRFGVEETMVEGVILLTAEAEGLRRQRYLEVFKLRNTAHAKGRHAIAICTGGIAVFPRGERDYLDSPPPMPALSSTRISSGVPALDALIGGGLLEGSVTLLSGSAGTGKTTLATQFLLEGANRGERGLYVSLEESPEQIIRDADALGIPLGDAVRAGKVEMLFLAPEFVRAGRFFALFSGKLGGGARRTVFDGLGLLEATGLGPTETRDLVSQVLELLRSTRTTSLFTLEANPMFMTNGVTEQGLSPFADNIIIMRYASVGKRLENRLLVLKTRGSVHDKRAHVYSVEAGGIRLRAAEPESEDTPADSPLPDPASGRRR